MSAALAVNAYRQVAKQGVSDENLLVLGLDGILEYVRRARTAITECDVARKAPAMTKAYQIVEHLMAALPPAEESPDASLRTRLDGIYRFLLERLAQANIFDDLQALDECKDVVVALRDSWIEGLQRA